MTERRLRLILQCSSIPRLCRLKIDPKTRLPYVYFGHTLVKQADQLKFNLTTGLTHGPLVCLTFVDLTSEIQYEWTRILAMVGSYFVLKLDSGPSLTLILLSVRRLFKMLCNKKHRRVPIDKYY